VVFVSFSSRWLPQHPDRHIVLRGCFQDELGIGGPAFDFLTILFPRQIEFFLREVLCALRASAFRFGKKLKTEEPRQEVAAFMRFSEHGARRSIDGLDQDDPATVKSRRREAASPYR
jgi:hypothetical protein